jgi:NADH:ubiquinone reductase (H+-translocating)
MTGTRLQTAGRRARVVVVGGGFGGTRAVQRLARRQVRGAVEVTLVDRTNHHVFAPLLYQVATAGLSPQDVAHSLRALTAKRPNVAVRLGTVQAVDLQRRLVHLGHGDPLPYDQLILAPGSVTADYGVPGVAEHALTLKSVSDAIAIRNHMLMQFETAAVDRHHDPGSLTMVVAGGGPTGVELAGAIAELAAVMLAKDFAGVPLNGVRIVLVEKRDALLPGFTEASRSYARRKLEGMGVEVRLGVGIRRVLPDSVELDDGSLVPTRTVVWAAGVQANPLTRALGVPLERSGRIAVEADLTLPGHPEVFVIGDAAVIRDARGVVSPQVAPAAMQQGRHAAEQVIRRLQGRPTVAFRYRNKGSMATIGRNAAVNEYPLGIRLRGFPAWLGWLALHVFYLAGFRNRLSALLTWGWSYLTFDRGLRVVVDSPCNGSEAHRGPAVRSADLAGRQPASPGTTSPRSYA